MEVLTPNAKEGGTYPIRITFKDEFGTLNTPISGTWSLHDASGNIINNRFEVTISPLNNPVVIMLQENDLVVDQYGVDRYLIVKIRYNSTLGNNLPSNREVRFEIDPKPNI